MSLPTCHFNWRSKVTWLRQASVPTPSAVWCLTVFASPHNQRTTVHFRCQKWNTSNYFTTEADQIALHSLASAHNSFKSCFTACGSWPVKSSLSASFHHRPLFFMPSSCVGREPACRCVAVVRGSEELCSQHQMETHRGDPHLASARCLHREAINIIQLIRSWKNCQAEVWDIQS